MIDRFNLDFNSMVSHPNDGDWVCWEDYEELQNRFSSLQSRLESLEKDAARYRWLRDIGLGEEWAIESPSGCCTQEHDSGSLDAAIDTAMQANKGE